MKDEYERLIEAGFTQRQISKELGVSHTTVRYWLQRYGLKTKTIRHRPRAENDERYVERQCRNHGLTSFIFEKSNNSYRCQKCRSGRVSEDRRKLKLRLVAEAGGSCLICGYNKSPWALHFHHRNPDDKEFEIGLLIRDRNYDRAAYEAAKCDLVCANCHAELEAAKWLES